MGTPQKGTPNFRKLPNKEPDGLIRLGLGMNGGEKSAEGCCAWRLEAYENDEYLLRSPFDEDRMFWVPIPSITKSRHSASVFLSDAGW